MKRFARLALLGLAILAATPDVPARAESAAVASADEHPSIRRPRRRGPVRRRPARRPARRGIFGRIFGR